MEEQKNIDDDLKQYPLLIIGNLKRLNAEIMYEFDVVDSLSGAQVLKRKRLGVGVKEEITIEAPNVGNVECVFHTDLSVLRPVWITFKRIKYPSKFLNESNENFYWDHVREWMFRNGKNEGTVVVHGDRIEVFERSIVASAFEDGLTIYDYAYKADLERESRVVESEFVSTL
jgi:hypothetical protein